MSVPTSAMDLPLEGAEDPARQICRQLLPGWDALSDQSMEVRSSPPLPSLPVHIWREADMTFFSSIHE